VRPGSIYVPAESGLAAFGETISWLWRLGPLVVEPDPAAVGLGRQEQAAELHSLVEAGALAGAVVFVTRPGPEEGPVPSRGWLSGKASFGDGIEVEGSFCILNGTAAVRSSLGSHAVREGKWMVVGADPLASWGTLRDFWVLPALADFLLDTLDRPLLSLPALGAVRYDDLPGNAYQLVSGRDHPDAKVRRLVERLSDHFSRHGAPVSLAVTPRALVEGAEVDLEQVWPESIAAIRAAIERGTVELVCHGYLHLNTAEWAAGRIDPREFRGVDEAESRRKLAYGLDWCERVLGVAPRSYVAPTWAYSPGLLDGLAERHLPTWLPPRPGPLAEANGGRETLTSGMEGLSGLRYGPLGRLPAAGVPLTMVLHGGLFDMRAGGLRDPRQALTTARLVQRRDLFRFPWVDGVRWVGSRELLDRLRGHGEVELDGDRIVNPAEVELVVRPQRTG
jgi:hypothetical protein